MINQTLVRIEQRLRDAALDSQEKQTLQELVGNLRAELEALPESSREQAASLAAFTEVAAGEAVRREKDPAVLAHATEGIGISLRRMGQDHPALTRVVGQLCDFLSGMGI